MTTSKEFLARNNKTYDIHIDEEEIEVYLDQVKQGSIQMRMTETDNPAETCYYILDLNLKNCRRQGIGRECLKSHLDVFGGPIFAADPYGPKMEDGSHLIDDGIPFIEQMRKEGIVCP